MRTEETITPNRLSSRPTNNSSPIPAKVVKKKEEKVKEEEPTKILLKIKRKGNKELQAGAWYTKMFKCTFIDEKNDPIESIIYHPILVTYPSNCSAVILHNLKAFYVRPDKKDSCGYTVTEFSKELIDILINSLFDKSLIKYDEREDIEGLFNGVNYTKEDRNKYVGVSYIELTTNKVSERDILLKCGFTVNSEYVSLSSNSTLYIMSITNPHARIE